MIYVKAAAIDFHVNSLYLIMTALGGNGGTCFTGKKLQSEIN